MDIFEHADVFTPSRTFLQEEEEAAAPSASFNLRPAVCVWNKRLVQQLYGSPRPTCDVLVVATCPTSCALLHAVGGKRLIGSVLAPGVSLAGNTLSPPDQPHPSDRVCPVYALGASDGGSGGGGGALLVAVQYGVPHERAGAWARAVLGGVSYGHAVFVGTIPAEQFRGEGDASQEELLFLLRSRTAAAAAAAAAASPVPLLPTGTIVGGLPAALLSHCQVRSQSADLLVVVEMVAEGRPALAAALAAALRGLLAARSKEGGGGGGGGAGELGAALAAGGVVSGARRALGAGVYASDVYA